VRVEHCYGQTRLPWHAQLMELNVDTVLKAVNDLHERTGKRVFTLIDIAEALGRGPVTSPPGMRAPTDADGNPLPERAPPVPAWVKVLNEILLHLGEEGKLPVMRTAMVTFPAE
jgi:hypothetical protein